MESAVSITSFDLALKLWSMEACRADLVFKAGFAAATLPASIVEGAFAWDLSYLRAAGIQPLAESQRSTVLNDTDAENFPSAAEASGVTHRHAKMGAESSLRICGVDSLLLNKAASWVAS